MGIGPKLNKKVYTETANEPLRWLQSIIGKKQISGVYADPGAFGAGIDKEEEITRLFGRGWIPNFIRTGATGSGKRSPADTDAVVRLMQAAFNNTGFVPTIHEIGEWANLHGAKIPPEKITPQNSTIRTMRNAFYKQHRGPMKAMGYAPPGLIDKATKKITGRPGFKGEPYERIKLLVKGLVDEYKGGRITGNGAFPSDEQLQAHVVGYPESNVQIGAISKKGTPAYHTGDRALNIGVSQIAKIRRGLGPDYLLDAIGQDAIQEGGEFEKYLYKQLKMPDPKNAALDIPLGATDLSQMALSTKQGLAINNASIWGDIKRSDNYDSRMSLVSKYLRRGTRPSLSLSKYVNPDGQGGWSVHTPNITLNPKTGFAMLHKAPGGALAADQLGAQAGPFSLSTLVNGWPSLSSFFSYPSGVTDRKAFEADVFPQLGVQLPFISDSVLGPKFKGKKTGRVSARGLIPNFGTQALLERYGYTPSEAKKRTTPSGSVLSHRGSEIDWMQSNKKGDANLLFGEFLNERGEATSQSIKQNRSFKQGSVTNFEDLVYAFPQLQYRLKPNAVTTGSFTHGPERKHFRFQGLKDLKARVNLMDRAGFQGALGAFPGVPGMETITIDDLVTVTTKDKSKADIYTKNMPGD